MINTFFFHFITLTLFVFYFTVEGEPSSVSDAIFTRIQNGSISALNDNFRNFKGEKFTSECTGGYAYKVTVSPDGNTLLYACANGGPDMVVYDRKERSTVGVYEPSHSTRHHIEAFTFGPKKNEVTFSDFSGKIKVWNFSPSQKEKNNIRDIISIPNYSEYSYQNISAMVYSPDHSLLTWINDTREMYVYQNKEKENTFELTSTLPSQSQPKALGTPQYIRVSPNGKLIAYGDDFFNNVYYWAFLKNNERDHRDAGNTQDNSSGKVYEKYISTKKALFPNVSIFFNENGNLLSLKIRKDIEKDTNIQHGTLKLFSFNEGVFQEQPLIDFSVENSPIMSADGVAPKDKLTIVYSTFDSNIHTWSFEPYEKKVSKENKEEKNIKK